MTTQISLFDYAALDTEARIIVSQEDKQFEQHMEDSGRSFIRACHSLKLINEALKYQRPGFTEYVASKPNLSRGTAYRMLDVAKMFPNLGNIQAAPSALYLLASPSTPEEAREASLILADAGVQVTHSEAKAIANQYKTTVPASFEVGQVVYLGERSHTGEVLSLGEGENGDEALVDFDAGYKRCVPIKLLRPWQPTPLMEQNLGLSPQPIESDAPATPLLPELVEELEPEPPLQPIIIERNLSQSVGKAVQTFRDNAEAAKRPRVANDYYPTPEKITRALIERFNFELDSVILEPCAGHGHIASLLDEYWESIANEPYPTDDFAPDYQMDATDPEFWEKVNINEDGFDWVVTNPPYESGAILPILKLSLQHARRGLAALIRLNYLEPCQDRRKWLAENADHMRLWLPISPRPQFRQDTNASDNITVAWCVWDKTWSWEGLGIDCPFQFVWDWR